MILGAHVSTAGGVSQAPLKAKELGISAIQIFSKNQHQWKAPPFTDREIEKWHQFVKDYGITHAVSHAAYLINLCAIDKEFLSKSREAFYDELVRADQLGLIGVVLHPGAHMNAGEVEGLTLIADSLKMVMDRHPDGKSKILLEVTAGQGTALGYRFEQVATLLEKLNAPERTGVCLDTCHIFAAGYDIVTPEGYEAMFQEFDNIIGLDKLVCIHLNDSKKGLGSRVDRHEHIGEGLIGSETFRRLLEDPRLKDIPALLETPGKFDDYARNLSVLYSLMGKEIR
ncbi:MAG: deoxyribonuclease IV [bacterium]